MTGKPERYTFDWRDPVNDTLVRIGITLKRNYIFEGQTHLEIESLVPKRAQLPITGTGYLSHFIAPLDLSNAGGPVVFVKAWLDREARGPAWRKRSAERAQGDLFSWADAHKDVAGTKPGRKPVRPKDQTPMAPRNSRKPTLR